MWKWSEVDRLMEGDEGIVPGQTQETVNLKEVFDATAKAATGGR